MRPEFVVLFGFVLIALADIAYEFFNNAASERGVLRLKRHRQVRGQHAYRRYKRRRKITLLPMSPTVMIAARNRMAVHVATSGGELAAIYFVAQTRASLAELTDLLPAGLPVGPDYPDPCPDLIKTVGGKVDLSLTGLQIAPKPTQAEGGLDAC